MARGRLLKSKVKEAKLITKSIFEGIQKADEDKPLAETFKEHLGRMIDRVDPLEVAAVCGLTPLVKMIIIDPANNLLSGLGLFTAERGEAWAYHLSSFWAFFDIFEGGLDQWYKDKNATKPVGGGWPDWMLWLISFAVAFLIVRHAGAILSAGAQTLTALVKMFMPLAVGAVQ